MASPSSPPAPREEDAAGAAAVCCMCGDHGLAQELFRCKSCRVRMQHSYCSNLYPRATSYKRCNWCLREPPPAQQGGAAAAHAANGNNNKPAADTKRKAASDEDRHQRQRHDGYSSSSSRRPPSGLGYPPVKKKRKADDAPDARVKGGCSNAGESNKEMMRAGKARVRVQRYKLLAEVISC